MSLRPLLKNPTQLRRLALRWLVDFLARPSLISARPVIGDSHPNKRKSGSHNHRRPEITSPVSAVVSDQHPQNILSRRARSPETLGRSFRRGCDAQIAEAIGYTP